MAIQIETTQNVSIQYEPANLGLRVSGYIIDIIIIVLWSIGYFGLIYSVAELNILKYSDFVAWAVFLLYFIPILFYDLLFEYFWNGQTPAKKILQTQVVNLDGTRPSFGSLLIRWLFRLVDFSLSNYIVSIAMVIATDNGQRLGDYLAKTTVIYLKSGREKDTIDLVQLNFNDDYSPEFPNVIDILTDKDIRIIRGTIYNYNSNDRTYVLSNLVKRVEHATGYSGQGKTDYEFLKRIVDDYTFLSLNR